MSTTDIRAALDAAEQHAAADVWAGHPLAIILAALIKQTRAALAAEVVGEGPVLQWTDNAPPNEDCRYDHCTAETPFGRFRISWKSWKQFDSPTVDETPWGDWYGAFDSVDEAKAACQEEINKRLARWGRPAAAPAPEVGEVGGKAPWGHGFDVKRLTDRLDELADYVTQGPDCVRRNFTMRVPAEPYHDADLVIGTAARLLRDCLAARPAAPPAPEPPAEALAARPLLEQMARFQHSHHSNPWGQMLTLSSRAAAWLRDNPPGQPVAIEPRGCPMPGACACVELAPPAPLEGEVGDLVEDLGSVANALTDWGMPGLVPICHRAATLLQQQEAELAALRPAAPPAPEVGGGDARCARIELVTAIYCLASHFEIACSDLDGDDLQKAKADIAHALSIAAKHNQNGPGCPQLSPTAPPAPLEGEVGVVVADLRCAAASYSNRGFSTDARRCRRAATLLQQLSAPAPAVVPVAVSERLPGEGEG